ncbi:MAG: ABC transporter ATP-binding protein [Rhodospirillales bacterium]|nr:ABC transporter ATP-binding protein [Rhodospirillales bacterium]
MNAPSLSMRGISKSFGPVQANKNVDLTLHAGDILGLLGENGAGKTTLMNILFGAYSADEGSIEIYGEQVAIHNSAVAIAHGVGMVHQHFHLVLRHTVLENLMVGLPGKNGLLDKATALNRLHEIGRQYHLHLDPDVIVGDLTIGEQQRLEIIKVLFRGARILILDEPTAALTPQETEGLFDALRAMVEKGLSIIFISHKLYEVRTITNHIMVMRQGEVTAKLENTPDVSERQIAELMCGHELVKPVKPQVTPGRALLGIANLSSTSDGRVGLKDINLSVHAGEIVGIAGVSGNGQRELADVIAGVLAPSAGSLEIDGAPVCEFSPANMQAQGIGRVPEDRMGTGLLTTLALCDNMVLPRISAAPFSRYGVLDRQAIRDFAEEQIEKFSIKAEDADVRAGTLSGGNLQKVLLARELAWDPLVMLAAQPTRGLDVGAAQFVHNLFLELRSRERGVLLISEDLEEIFTLSDRIAVMYEGRIMAILPIA